VEVLEAEGIFGPVSGVCPGLQPGGVESWSPAVSAGAAAAAIEDQALAVDVASGDLTDAEIEPLP